MTTATFTGDGTKTRFTLRWGRLKRSDGVDVFVNGVGVTNGVSIDRATPALVFTTAPAAGTKIAARARRHPERVTDFQPKGDLRAEDLNAEMDNIIAGQENLRAIVDHGVLTLPGSRSRPLTLPDPAPGKALVGDDRGGLVNADYPLDGVVTRAEAASKAAVEAAAAAQRDDNSASGHRVKAWEAEKETEKHKNAAETAKTGAEAARDEAETAKTGAEAARDEAETAKTGADRVASGWQVLETSARKLNQEAETAKTSVQALARSTLSNIRSAVTTTTSKAREATISTRKSETAKTGAEAARDEAETAKTGAEAARDEAETAKTGAEAARDEAKTAKTGAEAAKTLAETAHAGAKSSNRVTMAAYQRAQEAAQAALAARTEVEAVLARSNHRKIFMKTFSTTSGSYRFNEAPWTAPVRHRLIAASVSGYGGRPREWPDVFSVDSSIYWEAVFRPNKQYGATDSLSRVIVTTEIQKPMSSFLGTSKRPPEWVSQGFTTTHIVTDDRYVHAITPEQARSIHPAIFYFIFETE